MPFVNLARLTKLAVDPYKRICLVQPVLWNSQFFFFLHISVSVRVLNSRYWLFPERWIQYFPDARKNLVNDERYQLDATIVIYYDKYLYMFRASKCPSSGVQDVRYCIWCWALGVVAVVLRSWCIVLCTVCVSLYPTYTQCTRLHTSSSGPQPQHPVLNTICSNIKPVILKMDI
jgi:hypothetical protein